MREAVACVAWLVTGAVIITAMFAHAGAFAVAMPTVLGAVITTAIALSTPGADRVKPTTQAPAAGTVHDCNAHD